jgi:hypothetical protein
MKFWRRMIFLEPDMTGDDVIDAIGSRALIILGVAVPLYVVIKEITK